MSATSRKALVIGGTSGIGLASSLVLTREGWNVPATGATRAEVEQATAACAVPAVSLLCLDVTDDQMVKSLSAGLDQLGFLFSAAGIGRSPSEFTESVFCRTLEVNLTGTMRCCYASHSLLAASRGSNVAVASMMSFFGSATALAYAASKGAIARFTRSLAIAWAGNGIRTNAVAPGRIDTPMTRSMQANDFFNQRVLARSPLRRWGRPEEIGEVVAFLASAKASLINGAMIPVDGGISQ